MAIHKTTKGYTIRWYNVDGRERQRTYKGIDRQEAVQLERKILAERDRGESAPDQRHAPSFAAVAEQWLEEFRSGWKPSTLAQYQQVIRSQLEPAFGDVRVSGITDSSARQLVTRLQDGGMGPRRINLVLLVLKQILRSARRRRLIREDPLAAVKLLKEPRTEVDPLAPDEVDTFLRICPAWWRPYFTVAFWTGARPNELAAIKWGDVDMASGRFRIRAGRYRGNEGTPKTPGSTRDVDLLPPALEALRAQRGQQSALRLRLGQGAPEAGARLRVHRPDRRLAESHVHARPLEQDAGQGRVAPSWVAAQLGHTTAEMLFRVYARFIPNRTRRDGSALHARMLEHRPAGDAGILRAAEPGAGSSG